MDEWRQQLVVPWEELSKLGVRGKAQCSGVHSLRIPVKVSLGSWAGR